MKKTREEWIAEMMLMRRQPNPDTPEKTARATEMTRRYYEIWHWLAGEGPEPDPNWKPEHPPKDEAERRRDIEEYVERIYGWWLAKGGEE